MPVSSGPDLLGESNLVFAYDTGDVSNSYKGQPTTNLISNADIMSSWTTYYRTISSSTFITEFGTTGYRFENQPSWNGIYRNFNLINTGIYTFSAWFRYNGGSVNNNGATVYISNYGGGDTVVGLDKSRIGVWQRVLHTINVTSPSNVYFYLISYGGVDNGTGNPDFSSWEVTMPQIEQKPNATPFVNGTRSETQGLLSLVGTSTIDLTNVSFNSNAQMVFDGTNDRIIISQNSNFYTSNWTWELITKFTGNTDTYQGLVWAEGDTGGGSGLQYLLSLYSNSYFHYRINNTSTGWANTDTSTINFNPLNFNHIVWQFENGTTRIYINGSLFHTNSSRGSYSGGSNSPMYIGGRNDSAYVSPMMAPIYKFYNRPLTAQEVRQNYQQYKTRFNLS
jgi:hypothetical protein